jgi:hypothetical protein
VNPDIIFCTKKAATMRSIMIRYKMDSKKIADHILYNLQARKRIGPGGPPGLQIQSSGSDPVVGEFDSHTLPPNIITTSKA